MNEDNHPDPQLKYEPGEVAQVREDRIAVRCPYNVGFIPRAIRLTTTGSLPSPRMGA